MQKGFDVTIRTLEQSDYSEINQIYKTVIQEYLLFLREIGKREVLSTTLKKDYFNFYLGTENSLVAIVKGKIVGFVLAQVIQWINGDKKTLWLEYIAVRPKFRKKRVASSLLKRVKKNSIENSTGKLFAMLNVDNEESKRLLEKN